MTTETSAVGPTTIPVPIGGQDSDLNDGVLVGLLDFCGFLIKQALDTKLAEMRGPTTSAAITDACPTANRYPYDLGDAFVHCPLPSLSAWGVSAGLDDQMATIVYQTYRRDITLRYIFPALGHPDGQQNRNGLLDVVTKAVMRGAARGKHLSYGYDGDPAGTMLRESLNLISWRFIGATGGLLNTTPSTSVGTKDTRNVGYQSKGYPFVDIELRTWERVEGLGPDGDLMADGTFTQQYDETLDGVVRVLEPDNG